MKIEWRHMENCRGASNPDELCHCPGDPWKALEEAQACHCVKSPVNPAAKRLPCWCNGTKLSKDEYDGMRRGVLVLTEQREKAERERRLARKSDKAARDVLRQIRQWDMINPPAGTPDVIADARWLRELIDGVLGPA